MGRPIKEIMILDNSPHSYAFNPENAIPCESWFNVLICIACPLFVTP